MTKSLKWLDVLLGMICLIFFVDTCAPVSAMGVVSISWTLIIALIFFIPTGLITAELGAAYPGEGGMYYWVKLAYGKRWGARVSWMYWVNNAVWIASVAPFVVGLFSALFSIEMPFMLQLALMLACIWVIVLLGCLAVSEAKWIANLAAAIKLLFVVGIAACAIFYLASGNQPANDFSAANMIPSADQSLTYLPALIYNFLGFEAMLTLTSHMKNPHKDIPKAILLCSVLISVLYIIACTSILLIIPADSVDLVSGVIDAFNIAIGATAVGRVFTAILGILLLLVVISQVVSWLVAACRMAAATSDDNELPKFFGKRAKNHDAPVGALMIIGVTGTVLTLVYGAMASTAEDLFWTMFSFTSIIYLFSFIVNYEGYIKLRKTDKDTPRPFKFPGPWPVAWLFTRFVQFILIANILLFFWQPGVEFDWQSAVPLALGVIISFVIGEYLTASSLKKAGFKG